MYVNVSLSNFRDAFHKMGREKQFSHQALELLYDHFNELEESTGEKIKLDIIAICCEYEEACYTDVIKNYDDLDDDATIDDVIDFLQNNTLYIGRVGDDLVFCSSF